LSSALDGTNGFILNGIAVYDYSGVSVSGAGDVNGDGPTMSSFGALRRRPQRQLFGPEPRGVRVEHGLWLGA
jgi:hypothetical protein